MSLYFRDGYPSFVTNMSQLKFYIGEHDNSVDEPDTPQIEVFPEKIIVHPGYDIRSMFLFLLKSLFSFT